MLWEKSTDLVVVSDLHLSTDPSDGGERTAAAFSAFLADLGARAHAEQRTPRLVFLGDLFDFRTVASPAGHGRPAHGDTSAAATVARLEAIRERHPGFFVAVRRWLGRGYNVEIVPGNHDTELVWPAVQERLRELLHPEGRGLAGRVRCHPWILHVPGVLYAEHGHQYDALGSYAMPLRPHPPDRLNQVEPPLGALFARHVLDRIRPRDPTVDRYRPHTRYLIATARTRPLRSVALLGLYARFGAAVFGLAGRGGRAAQRRRAAYREEILPRYAAEVGLRPRSVLAVHVLAARPALGSKRRLLRTLYTRAFPRPDVHPAGSLPKAAARIHAALRAEGESVPYYIFGHAHRPEDLPLPDGARYLNSGTWTRSTPDEADPGGRAVRFPYVEVRRVGDGVGAHLRHFPWTGTP